MRWRRRKIRYLTRRDHEVAVGWLERAKRAESTIEQHEDLLSSICLYIDWRYVTRQLTTEQKELFADALDRDALRVHGPDGEDPDPEMAQPSRWLRWWRPDAVDPSSSRSPAGGDTQDTAEETP